MYYSELQKENLLNLEPEDKEDNPFEISAIDIIDAWREYEVDLLEDINPEDWLENLMDIFEKEQYDECGNSFNWCGPLDHHFDYRSVRIDRQYFTLVAWHRYGDVRGNYTGYTLYKTNFEEDLFWALEEECCKVTELKIDNKDVAIRVSPLYDKIEVGLKEDDYWYEEIEGIYDMEDLVKYLRGND